MLRVPLLIVSGVLGTAILLTGVVRFASFQYSYVPHISKIVNPPVFEKSQMHEASIGSEQPGPPVDDKLIRFGRKAFYGETFGNEVFFTDVLGAFDGALTIPNIIKASVLLKGAGTTNLRVEAAKTVTVGGRTIHKGDWIDTGLDVPKGSFAPLGVKLVRQDGRWKAGIGCIMCHAIADLPGKRVIEGVPNPDINVGLMLALGTNSAAFFTHTDVERLQDYMNGDSSTVPIADSSRKPLPDPDRLEEAVDKALLKWPPGYVDTMIDLKNNPVQIPDTFTAGDYPYSWSGLSSAGPMHGLVFLSGIPNGQNMDPLGQAPISQAIFNIDKDVYIGTILQRAASAKYRYDPRSGEKPSAFLKRVDPTPGGPGLSEEVPSPAAPQSSLVSLVGSISTKPYYPIAYHIYAMAAYQNALKPPATGHPPDAKVRAAGRETFERAGCIACHAGTYLTNNRIVPSEQIGTEPSRAMALQKAEANWGENRMYDWDTPVPLPRGAKTFLTHSFLDQQQQHLALGGGGTKGGYKVPSLYGLYWSAPYLHDGGVSVGADDQTAIGIPGTLYRGVSADPANSLRALLDRRLRERVVDANRADPRTQGAHITGEGHAYWVDKEDGFTQEQQDALIQYLLKLHDQDAKPGGKRD